MDATAPCAAIGASGRKRPRFDDNATDGPASKAFLKVTATPCPRVVASPPGSGGRPEALSSRMSPIDLDFIGA